MTRTVEKACGLLTLDEARQRLGLSVRDAAHLAGLSSSAVYLACERGEIESTRLCGRILVLSVPFMRQFGLVVDDKVVTEATSSLNSNGSHECKSCRKVSK